ncbi:hypothetical protein CASFOL_009827 [Castilleja foliolosa]|uniref:C2H2-type domain-containing protein n=1 Tax=Castilleja foliolosa TaxID=1961234 RepID=A0ABD3DSN8_9LAMI
MKHTITLIIILTTILVTPMDQQPPPPIRPTPLHRAITPPPPPPSRPPTPPILGLTGRLSAFAPYTRARLQTTTAPSTQPRPPFHEGGSSSTIQRPPTGFGTGYHWFPPSFLGAQALMAGGGGTGCGGGVAVATALGFGGGSPASRKRGLEKSGASGPGESPGKGGAPPGPADRERVNCSICNKEFGSSKALFGHMRSHPDRGWKGAHPPPRFRASEDFADLGPLFQPLAPADQPDPVPAPAHTPAQAIPPPAPALVVPATAHTPAQAFPPPAPAQVPAPPAPAATEGGEEGAADVAEEGAAAGGAGGRFIPDLNN